MTGLSSARLLVGGYTDDPGPDSPAGLVAFRLVGDRLVMEGPRADLVSPSYVLVHPTRPVVYAVRETARSGLVAVDRDSLDVLVELDLPGEFACHLAMLPDRRHLLVACYGDGAVVCVRIDDHGRPAAVTDVLTTSGRGPHARQGAPHAHHVLPLVDDAGVALVADLGADLIRRVIVGADGSLREGMPLLRLPPGTGPRQARRAHGGRAVYVLGELTGELVTAVDGKIVDRCSASRPRPVATNLPAHLLLDGTTLYVSHRGYDRVTAFDVSDLIPRPLGEFGTGRTPRHIAVSDGWLYTANQDDDRVTARPLADPDRVIEVAMHRPSCVVIVPARPGG